jgi:RNA polymerase sigma-70 factor (ECF subfamily)
MSADHEPSGTSTDTSPLDDVRLDAELDAAFERHRKELTGYCYRMLGAPSEAEDAVQETLLRAWRAADRFEGRATARTWLYRIAHNVCIDMHRSPQRRARPMEMGPASRTSELVLGDQREEHVFVQPAPDAMVVDLSGDPAEVAAARESIRLAFVAALQHLPPKQRSVLILCEVLKVPAAEVADLLGTTVASVNSALQRARATLADRPVDRLDDPLDERHQQLLARYVDAFERYDIDELVTLLRDDAILSMPPWDTWIQGRDELYEFYLGPGAECRGSRLLPIALNGCAGFAQYRQTSPGVWTPWSMQVIEVADGRITAHHNFLYPEMFTAFGFPARFTADDVEGLVTAH